MEIALILLVLGAAAWSIFRDGKSAQIKRGAFSPQTPRTTANTPAIPEKFIVFDFETTGLDCYKHEIIEIGAIKVDRDGVNHETYQILVKPNKRFAKKITEITGITKEMLEKDGVPIEKALPEFLNFIEDLPLVAFNSEFDMGFLSIANERLGNKKLKNKVSCALKLARKAWPGRDSYKLSSLAEDGGLSTEDAHRALGDCRRTMTVYASAVEKIRSGQR
jgi:DNA polymerase III subunit epsilon